MESLQFFSEEFGLIPYNF